MVDDTTPSGPEQPEDITPDQTGSGDQAGSTPVAATGAAAASGAHADESGQHTSNKVLLGVIAAIVAIALAVGAFFFFRKDDKADPAPQAPKTGGPASPAPSTQSSAKGEAGGVPAGCSPVQTPMNDPKSFAIDRMKLKGQMLSLGIDSSGAAAAPPLNDLEKAKNQVGWFNQGPKLGSAKGNAVLTIHTYSKGVAMGNQLYDKKNGFKVGDLVKITGADGKTLCYTLEKELKVWVKDYDPNSDVLYNHDGKPQAVIVICWDYNKPKKEWDSRILYYLKPVGKVQA